MANQIKQVTLDEADGFLVAVICHLHRLQATGVPLTTFPFETRTKLDALHRHAADYIAVYNALVDSEEE